MLSNSDYNQEHLSSEAKELDDLFQSIIPQIIQYVNNTSQSKVPVSEDLPPIELTKQLDLTFGKKLTKNELVDTIQSLLKHSVCSWDPKFCDKLYAATNPVGVISELLLATLNANSHVYHVAPVLTQFEIATGRELALMFGMNGSHSGGMTFPGGSASNMTAMVTARNLKFPHIKEDGYTEKDKISIFTSSHAHYSIDKSAIGLGIGTKRVYKIPVDNIGRMEVSALKTAIESSISKGEVPFFVNCTAGTTVLGAYDNIEEIFKVTKLFNLWLHVDGSWGGPAVFSSTHKKLVEGAKFADSLTLNPHKLLGVPLQCSFLVLQDRRLLPQANSLKADYLFHSTSQHKESIPWLTDSMDLGDGTLGCGRRCDAFKMYLTWKYYGTAGLASRVDKAFFNAQYLAEKVANHPNLQLAFLPQSVNICFWYRPNNDITFPHVASKEFAELDQELPERWGKLTQEIQGQLRASGQFMVDYAPASLTINQKHLNLPYFFRMVVNSPAVSSKHLDILIDSIITIGRQLESTLI